MVPPRGSGCDGRYSALSAVTTPGGSGSGGTRNTPCRISPGGVLVVARYFLPLTTVYNALTCVLQGLVGSVP